MSLPLKAVDRLFDRLLATYGRQFTDLYAQADAASVKTAWAHELAGYASENGLKAVAWALENLPERCPNAIQFRNLCRQAPAPEAQRLPEPTADPARVAAELAKLASARREVSATGIDRKAWVKRIIARHEAGEKIRPISLLFARQALGLTREAAPMRREAA